MGEAMRTQGYAATGIKRVVEASGAPNGSLYHHFPGGKRDVAATALRQMGAAYAELVTGLFAKEGDLGTVIESAFVAAAEDMEQTGFANMCPVGTVAGEVADTEPELRSVVADIVDMWISGGTDVFVGRGLADEDARTLVTAVIAALEGAFVLARTQRSRDPLLAAGRAMGAFAASLPVASGPAAEPNPQRAATN